MTPFSEIEAKVRARKGADLLGPRPPHVRSAGELSSLGDDRVLAALTRCVFAAGFRWKVIEAKWPGFEAAFEGFEPEVLASWSAEDLDRLVLDARIVRNPVNIRATLANASWMLALAESHGSVASWIAHWPSDDIIGLWMAMKAGGTRLGGLTGPRVLRLLGKDTFLLTPDVVTGLRALGLLTASENSKRGQKAVSYTHLTLPTILRV